MTSGRIRSCVAHNLRPLYQQSLRANLISPSTIRTATTSSLPKSGAPPPRRAVTVVSDTGQIPWKQLSVGEKAARTTQQSFNLLIVLTGVVLTVGVGAALWLEVFSSESKTAVFNRTADRIRRDERCIEALAGRGHGREIEAHGQDSWSRWARNRFIA
jgi:import inner membrane translocase subunit TIM21